MPATPHEVQEGVANNAGAVHAATGTTLNYFLDGGLNRAAILFPGIAAAALATVFGAFAHVQSQQVCVGLRRSVVLPVVAAVQPAERLQERSSTDGQSLRHAVLLMRARCRVLTMCRGTAAGL